MHISKLAITFKFLILIFWGCNIPKSDISNTQISSSNYPSAAQIGEKPSDFKAKLVAAYPDFLKGYHENSILFHDGTEIQWDDGKEKEFAKLESDADLEDMFRFAYPIDSVRFEFNYDPGRIRQEEFFKKMYGNSPQEVKTNLVTIQWLPNLIGKEIQITKVNGVNRALEAVSKDLEKIGKDILIYLDPIAGTFNWRKIAGTEQLSVHSFGAAIDLNVSFSDYWRWSAEFKQNKALKYRNRIPLEIVKIFEKQGFIWGGKWFHYDTMHFEYRPELL